MISIYAKYTSALAALSRIEEDEHGQGLFEYALILALIAIISIAALTLFGGKVTSMLSTVASTF